MSSREPPFASRAGLKLAGALDTFALSPLGLVAADLGANAGGFVDCLLRRGAVRVFAVERGYGVLDYRLRQDPRVVPLERTDALRLRLPQRVDLVTIDLGWTRQALILPVARELIVSGGRIVSLVKPHYEADPELLSRGVLPADQVAGVVEKLRAVIEPAGLRLLAECDSPLPGSSGNREVFWLLEAR